MSWLQKTGSINIIKMHGSLNWHDNSNGGYFTKVTTLEPTYPYNQKPWLVLGDKEKLSTKGPTLPLLRAAENSLEKTHHLVIAGYSFSDDHINDLIHGWIAHSPLRTISIIDPEFPTNINYNSFQNVFIYKLCVNYSNRITIIRKTTKDSLTEAINQFPENPSENWFKIKNQTHENDSIMVTIELTGRMVQVNNFWSNYGNIVIKNTDNTSNDKEKGSSQNFLWKHGTEICFYISKRYNPYSNTSDESYINFIEFEAYTHPDNIPVREKLDIKNQSI